MAIAASAIVNGTDSSVSGTTATVTLVPAAGDSMEVLITCNNAQTITTPTSSPSETWTLLVALNDGAAGQRTELWVANNVTGGSTVITETYSAAITWRAMSGKVISGTSGYDSAAAAKAGQVINAGTGTDATTSGNTPALTSQPALISGWCFEATGASLPAAGTGFTNDGTGIGWGGTHTMRSESKILTSTSAVAATFTAGAANNQSVFAAVYLETGGVNNQLFYYKA
jgi:hypothetical protein